MKRSLKRSPIAELGSRLDRRCLFKLRSGSRSQFLSKIGIGIAISILAIGVMPWISYKKVCNFRARRRQANQQQAKQDAKWRPILSLRAVLALKIGLAKFQCCRTFILDLVYLRFQVGKTIGHSFFLVAIVNCFSLFNKVSNIMCQKLMSLT